MNGYGGTLCTSVSIHGYGATSTLIIMDGNKTTLGFCAHGHRIALEKTAAPSFLLEKETCSCTKGCKNRRCECVKAGIPCKYCACKECKNKIPANIIEEHGIESSELEDVINSDMTDNSGSESDAEYVVSTAETE